MTRRAEAPDGTRRLFSQGPAEAFPPPTPGTPAAELFVGRLLEEGDSDDLRWLVAGVGEEHLRDWLRRRGARQLSRRSYRFWHALLDRDGLSAEPARGALVEALWPL